MLTEGMFLVDRYEIIGKVGAGGMSDVYKVKDHILGRIVAVKVLKPEFSEDINFVTKFRAEAQSAAGLEHPNIVNVYDVGSENGLHFIVMEHIEGITLKTYIEKKGQLSFKEATSIAIQVARGIEAAHNKDIIHRDIKPQNIIISTEGTVKVTDFGIARAVSSNTISAEAMGSVHYASPEQARNGFVDGRSDIYSLGIVMYEMVTGRVPFDGETTIAVAMQHLQEEMVEPSRFAPDIPISYEKIILKATQKSPDRRYQDISEFLADLRKALVTPDEDFVEIAPVLDSKTRVIGEEEIELLRNTAENTDMKKETTYAAPSYSLDDVDEEEEDEDEGFLDPKMEKAVTIAGIVVAALMFIIVIFLVLSMLGVFDPKDPNPQPPAQSETQSETQAQSDMVEMIDIVGMSKEDAKKAVEKLGLKFNVLSEKASAKKKGTVIEQLIDEGDKVKKGTTVNVVIAGEVDKVELVKVPDVVSMEEEEAVENLKDAGFRVLKEYAKSKDVAKGLVISQSVKAESEQEPGTRITIVISTGPDKEYATIPEDISDRSLEGIKAVLETLGFKWKVVKVDNDADEGTILEVENAGKEAEIGSTIKIYVSTGVTEDVNTEDTEDTEDTENTEAGSTETESESESESEAESQASSQTNE